jgi:hypothetical protein
MLVARLGLWNRLDVRILCFENSYFWDRLSSKIYLLIIVGTRSRPDGINESSIEALYIPLDPTVPINEFPGVPPSAESLRQWHGSKCLDLIGIHSSCRFVDVLSLAVPITVQSPHLDRASSHVCDGLISSLQWIPIGSELVHRVLPFILRLGEGMFCVLGFSGDDLMSLSAQLLQVGQKASNATFCTDRANRRDLS